MRDRRRTVLHAVAATIAAAVPMACGEDQPRAPTAPSIVEVQAGTSTEVNAEGQIGDASDGDALDVFLEDDGLNVFVEDGGIRAARSDAMIAKPVIWWVSRVSNRELGVFFSVANTTDINDFRLQWSPGCMTSWSRKIGGESTIVDATAGTTDYLAPFFPQGGNLLHRAFKVRIRSRMAANTATHRMGGPWSDVALLYPGNPSSKTTDDEIICAVGMRATSAEAFACLANIDAQEAVLEVDDTTLALELNPGTGRVSDVVNRAHAAGAVAAFGGFRVEARTSPDAWEIVSLDQEWRAYC